MIHTTECVQEYKLALRGSVLGPALYHTQTVSQLWECLSKSAVYSCEHQMMNTPYSVIEIFFIASNHGKKIYNKTF